MKTPIYRDMIDHLVDVCKNGQGQISSDRVKRGIWNANAKADFIPEQHKINEFLLGLSPEQKEILSGMLEQEFMGGVFESLKALEEFQIKPFEDGYEGSPFNDFIGRVDDDPWEWPEE